MSVATHRPAQRRQPFPDDEIAVKELDFRRVIIAPLSRPDTSL